MHTINRPPFEGQHAGTDGGPASGFGPGLISSAHSPASLACSRSLAASATCSRPSTFVHATRWAARPLRSSSAIKPRTQRCRVTRRASAARVWGSSISILSASSSGRLPAGPLTADSPIKGQAVSGARLSALSSTAMGVAMSMDRSFPAGDRQLKATAGKGSQVPMPFLAAVSDAQRLPNDVLASATFNGCLIEAARHSGMEDQEIADAIHICHGYMSRFMRGIAQQWAKRLVAFMRVTRSLAPLQWIAREMGCEVVVCDSRAAEVAALRARLKDLEHAA